MMYFRWIILFLLSSASFALAQDTAGVPLTPTEIRTELFGLHSPDPSQPRVFPQDTGAVLAEKKSVGLAAIYSLLLPGMGETYTGAFTSSGKYFLLAEGILWVTFAAFEISGNSLQTDARTYSAANAGVLVAGKNDQFFVDIGNYLTVDDYNQQKLRDRQPQKIYDPAAGYAWQWVSDEARQTFRDQRIASDQMYNDQKFVVAAILLNHIVSAINAGRSAVAYNSVLSQALKDVEFGARVMGSAGNSHGVMLTIQKGF